MTKDKIKLEDVLDAMDTLRDTEPKRTVLTGTEEEIKVYKQVFGNSFDYAVTEQISTETSEEQHDEQV